MPPRGGAFTGIVASAGTTVPADPAPLVLYNFEEWPSVSRGTHTVASIACALDPGDPRDTTQAKFGGASVHRATQVTFAAPLALLGDFAIQFWVRWPTGTAEGFVFALDNMYLQFYVGHPDVLYYTTTAGYSAILYIANRSDVNSGDTPALGDDQWHHVSVQRSAGYLAVYLDGTLWSDPNANAYFPDPVTATATGLQLASGGFGGWIDDFRIVDGRASLRVPIAPYPPFVPPL